MTIRADFLPRGQTSQLLDGLSAGRPWRGGVGMKLESSRADPQGPVSVFMPVLCRVGAATAFRLVRVGEECGVQSGLDVGV